MVQSTTAVTPPALICDGSQGLISANFQKGAIPDTHNAILVAGNQHYVFASERWAVWNVFFRPLGGTYKELPWRMPSYVPYPTPQGLPQPLPSSLPRPWIVLDPFDLPIKVPVPMPTPIPMPLTGARINNSPSRDAGYLSVPRFEITPRIRNRPQPRKRDREKKLRGTPQIVRLLQKWAHGATELDDFLESLHEALPKNLRAKSTSWRFPKPTPQAKAAAIVKHWDKIDWSDAVVNLVKNHIGDEIIGRVSGKAGQEMLRRDVILGLQG